MSAVTVTRPLRRRSLERQGMTPEQELELLIAEQQADDTYYIDRPEGVISLDAPAPNMEGTIGELLYLGEDGYIVVPSVVSASRGGRSTALGSTAPLGSVGHGTRFAYNRLKCRCSPCRGANAQYLADYRRRKRAES